MSALPTMFSVEVPDTHEIELQAASSVDEANRIQVTDASSYEYAGEFMKGLVAISRAIDEHHDDAIADANKLHKKLIAKKKKVSDPVTRSLIRLKSLRSDWRAEQDRLQREADRRRLEAARKAEEEQRLERAIAIEQSTGNAALAEVILNRPTPVAVAFAPPIAEAPKTDGTAVRKIWSAELVDKAELVQFIAANPMFLNLVDVNFKAANEMARSLKEQFAIPGLRAACKESEAVRLS